MCKFNGKACLPARFAGCGGTGGARISRRPVAALPPAVVRLAVLDDECSIEFAHLGDFVRQSTLVGPPMGPGNEFCNPAVGEQYSWATLRLASLEQL